MKYAAQQNSPIFAKTKHIRTLEHAAQWVAQWKFGSSKEPPTVQVWQITIHPVLALWEEVHKNLGFECLLTRRLNQDPLENMFGECRRQHGCNETPDAFQIVAGLKYTLAGRLLKLHNQGNCEADEAYLLAELRRMPLSSVTSVSVVTEPAHNSETHAAEESEHKMHNEQEPENLVEANAQYAFAGSLVRSFLQESTCTLCPNLVKAAEQGLQSALDVFSFLHGQSCPPSDVHFKYNQLLEYHFQHIIDLVLHKRNVKKLLLDELHQQEEGPFCSSQCKLSFFSMFSLKRLLYHIRLRNKELAQDVCAKSSAKRKYRKVACK